MKVVIIDDERKARNVLKILIEENCPKITKIFEAEDLKSGIDIIKEELPNIVFLDVEMPEHSGLEILNFIEKEVYDFEIIFTTAYNDYAIQAFQLSAIDYLLKPVSASKVKEAVDKALKFLGASRIDKRLKELKKSFVDNNFSKIGLPVADGIKFLDFKDIIMLEADGMYTKISSINEESIMISKPLRYFVELLEKQNIFYKPHRSYLINLSFIKEYIKKYGGYILMDNDKTVSISKDKKDEFLAIVSNMA